MAIETDAGRIGVCIGEWEAHFGVVKASWLPRNRVVTLLAGLREPSSNVVRIRSALEVFQMA